MRLLLPFSFILLYLFSLTGSLLPFVHFTMNKERIVSELCENREQPELKCEGHCYLSKQLIKEQNRENKSPQKVISPERHYVVQASFTIALVAPTMLKNEHFISYTSAKNRLLETGVFHPPQV